MDGGCGPLLSRPNVTGHSIFSARPLYCDVVVRLPFTFFDQGVGLLCPTDDACS